MSIIINSAGLYTPGGIEDRSLIVFDVEYEGNTYPWSIYTIEGQTIDQTIEYASPIIEQRIAGQLANNETVVPDVPDYYAKRRVEYPAIGDQLGAIFKGLDSQDYIDMVAKIEAVKNKYPKTTII
jgi:hypothetical protein